MNSWRDASAAGMLGTCASIRGRVRGGREGALALPDLPKFFLLIFMCVVVKGGDLIEIVINSA